MLHHDLVCLIVHLELLSDVLSVLRLSCWFNLISHAFHQLMESASLKEIVQDLKLIILHTESHS